MTLNYAIVAIAKINDKTFKLKRIFTNILEHILKLISIAIRSLFHSCIKFPFAEAFHLAKEKVVTCDKMHPESVLHHISHDVKWKSYYSMVLFSWEPDSNLW